jgi:acetylornithine deacetylase/succinyl-diaminopimelate desuccinylase-like protein
MDCEFALNEGGWIIKDEAGKVQYVSISTADKGGVGIILTARGTSTHSSMPRPDNAIFTLNKAMAKLADYDTKVQLTPATRQFFMTLSKTSAPPLAGPFPHDRDEHRRGGDRPRRQGGQQGSADPRPAQEHDCAGADERGFPRQRDSRGPPRRRSTCARFLAPIPTPLVEEFQRVIADPRVEVTLAESRPRAAAERALVGGYELFRSLVRQARATFPGAEVTPYLFQAGTDADGLAGRAASRCTASIRIRSPPTS